MIKELLISLAVAAASGVSFVGSPKRAQSDVSEYWGNYSFTMTPNENGFIYFDVGVDSPVLGPYQRQIEIGGWHLVDVNEKLGVTVQFTETQDPNYSNYYKVEMGVQFLCGASFRSDIYALLDSASFTSGWGKQTWDSTDGVQAVFTGYISKENGHESELQLSLEPVFNLQKNFINCDIASSPRPPSTYGRNSQLTYYVLMTSAAGGYGFTSESVSQTGGITIRNFNLFDQYNNSGYYASCSFNVDLPLNNCSLSVTAFLPQYTITSTLEHCTASPSIPSSYTGTSFSGDYTFTADSGYGFNENYTHWEVSNLFIDSVEFSSLLWGSFYSSVTLHLRASGGNSSISVTAIKYDEESYKLGYDEGRADGWQAGYDKGHADGEIAGNSYGVWNWLKQAAITTGEFLSIPLLPGFSIGGLLTALAGLVIIWFFIKGFLFKS